MFLILLYIIKETCSAFFPFRQCFIHCTRKKASKVREIEVHTNKSSSTGNPCSSGLHHVTHLHHFHLAASLVALFGWLRRVGGDQSEQAGYLGGGVLKKQELTEHFILRGNTVLQYCKL